MAHTKVRVFFVDAQVLGVVIPTTDDELDLHHKALIAAPHNYVDLSLEEYDVLVRDPSGLPNIPALHPIVKAHPKVEVAQ